MVLLRWLRLCKGTLTHPPHRAFATKKQRNPATTTTTSYKAPAVRLPTLDYLQGINDDWHLELEEKELEDLRGCMRNTVAAYQRVDELTTNATTTSLTPQFPRLPGGTRPAPEDNPYNAWYFKTDIKGRTDGGLLHGKTVAVKDTIAVAGVPMMNGSRILEGYVPDFEATAVTRVLEAGGTIAGKAVAEDLCCSASSFATALGAVRNPWNEKYAAGGSSSGCGALVGGNVVDMALGTDQGGSIRIPASWCGCVGLKPTFGLVPYTGIASHEFTLDHVGPMARTVHDAALLLEAIAGPDPQQRDARQPPNLAAVLQKYASMATGDVKGLRIGVVTEGLENCEVDVTDHTLSVAEKLRQAGAKVEEVSIPLHRDSAAIWLPLCLEGGHATRIDGERGYRGYYPVSLSQAYIRGFRLQAAELSYTNKFYVLFGEYMKENYGSQYYQKCQNMVPALTAAYDAVLKRDDGAGGFDALLLPTAPIKALPLPPADMTAAQCIAQAWGALQNTAAFDLTGHPALSVNAGFSSCGEELPIGVQVVGRRWDDAMILNVGRAIELGRGEEKEKQQETRRRW